MKVLTLFIMMLFVNLHSGSQSFQAATSEGNGIKNQKPDSLPTARAFRPKISLQEGLKIAEDYINQQHIDIGPFWLYRARYTLLGDEKTPDQDKIPGWHFWWVNESGALGDYVEIFVDMNGKASRLASL